VTISGPFTAPLLCWPLVGFDRLQRAEWLLPARKGAAPRLALGNLFGIWRWLGRQARIEEGETVASERSRESPGETLFPVSLLSKAKLVTADGTVFGHGVDAMAGCANGAIRYLVVSEGGVAGVGETLRRLDWSGITIDGETIRCRLDSGSLCSLEPIEADQWPTQ
jgi:hypothetical protein